MHDVGDVDSMRHRARIEHFESAIQVDSERPAPNGLARGQIDAHIASDGRQSLGVATVQILCTQNEQSIEGCDERDEHVVAVDVSENLRETDRILGSPSHVQTETYDDVIWYIHRSALMLRGTARCRRDSKDSSELARPDHDVVGPLQGCIDTAVRNSGNSIACLQRRQRDGLGQLMRTVRHVSEQDADEKVDSRRCLPSPIEPPSAGCLVIGHEDEAIRRALLPGEYEVLVRASRGRQMAHMPPLSDLTRQSGCRDEIRETASFFIAKLLSW